MVNALCCHRADVNYRAKDGATPLLIAAEFGEFNVSWLCEEGGSKVENAPMIGQFLEQKLFLYQVCLVCSSVR